MSTSAWKPAPPLQQVKSEGRGGSVKLVPHKLHADVLITRARAVQTNLYIQIMYTEEIKFKLNSQLCLVCHYVSQPINGLSPNNIAKHNWVSNKIVFGFPQFGVYCVGTTTRVTCSKSSSQQQTSLSAPTPMVTLLNSYCNYNLKVKIRA